MVIVKLYGGLGNQLFQYSAARNLSLRLKTEIKLDLSWYETEELRKYGLGSFNIVESFAAPEEVSQLTERRGLLRKVFNKPPVLTPNYIREKKYHFDPSILNLSGNVYLDGYWQSEKYFCNSAGTLKKELRVKAPLTGRNKELAGQIKTCESVSLHIRRGDFVSNSKASHVHGVCDPEYYIKSCKYIAQRTKPPHFYLFTDSPEWVAKNLELPYPFTLVDHNGPDLACEDLRLMSFCRHNITANSSFSWWGAWLNDNPGKIVMIPQVWFLNEKLDTKDLIPEGWIKEGDLPCPK